MKLKFTEQAESVDDADDEGGRPMLINKEPVRLKKSRAEFETLSN